MLNEPPEPLPARRPVDASYNLRLSRRRRAAELRRRQQIRRRRFAAVAALLALLLVATVATAGGGGKSGPSEAPSAPPLASPASFVDHAGLAPGMPAPLDPHDVYAADRPNALAAQVRGYPQRVYVPNSQSNTVDVIDQRSFRIVDRYPVGALPQHVTPSYDMKRLWVDNDLGNSLTPVDPATGRPAGSPVPVEDPYNLYFTPDGHNAIVVAEQLQRLDFRDPHTMRMKHSLPVACPGVDHMDFTADGRYLLASCEFAGQMIVVDALAQRVVKTIPLRAGGMPQDVKLAPDGSVFYVADMQTNGAWIIDGHSFKVLGVLPTGLGAHGLYASRDSRVLYVSNRGEGSISVVSFKTRKVVARWQIPGGGSPDMGGLSADGKVLWLTGRYNAEVYALSTADGHLLARIPVGAGPHGLCVYPQPGRYSTGHTGVFR